MRRSPCSAASTACRVPGRPAEIGTAVPGKTTVSRRGSTGSISFSLIDSSQIRLRPTARGPPAGTPNFARSLPGTAYTAEPAWLQEDTPDSAPWDPPAIQAGFAADAMPVRPLTAATAGTWRPHHRVANANPSQPTLQCERRGPLPRRLSLVPRSAGDPSPNCGGGVLHPSRAGGALRGLDCVASVDASPLPQTA